MRSKNKIVDQSYDKNRKLTNLQELIIENSI